jgi:hypothetical protein
MGDEITIDKSQFHDRLSSLQAQWKADKRTGDALFNNVGSIHIAVGKASEKHHGKSASTQVSLAFARAKASRILMKI